jgi:signal transduction protein with GAF and PtsI domain
MSDMTTHLNVLQATAYRLGSALKEKQVIQVLLEQASAAFDARGVMIRLLSSDGKELVPAGALGLSNAYLSKGPVWLTASDMDYQVIAGETIIVEDVSREPGFQYPDAAAAEGLHGLIAVPLQVREHVIGVLRIYVDDVDLMGEDEILVARALAALGALALEKTRLHQSLYCIAEVLNSSQEVQPLLRDVLEATVREMDLKAGSIRLLDPKSQTLRLVASHGLSETYLSKGEIHKAHSPVDVQALQGHCVIIHDVQTEPGFEYPEEATREGIFSVLVVPLKLKERTLGVMRVYSGRPRHFTEVAATFLTSVADLVALAIERAELHAALQSGYDDLKLDMAEWYRFLALG